MNLCKTKSRKKAMSMVEVLVVIFLIATSLLLVIQIFPSIFMLNRKTDDIILAKNFTEYLFQALRSEVNTKLLAVNQSGLNTTDALKFHDNGTINANNIINVSKCFWQLVTLTQDPNSFPDPNIPGLDTYLNSSNLTADTKFNAINPSRYEPVNDPNNDDWVVNKQFWLNWRKNIETQLPPGSFTSSERASAIVTARYVYIDPNTNIFKVSMSDFTQFSDMRNVIGHPSDGYPSLVASKYMVEVTVAMYWKDRLAKGTYTRNIATPRYKLSTLITPPFNNAVKQVN